MICLGLLGACQSESADTDLPPLSLNGPAISRPVAVAPRPAPQPLPLYAAAPPPAPAPTWHPRSTPSDSVPAAWIPRTRANQWTWIIVHHSDSDYGSAAIIDKWHRDRGFDELGYHFVIGNGTNSGDGQIEVGPRWSKQKWGAHDNALDNRYNEHGIGICLVGDFNKTRPTAAQRRSLTRLILYLMRTYEITPDHVLGHGETKDTQCPGRYLRAAELRATIRQMLVAEGDSPATSEVAAGQELLEPKQ
jgi:hypothetical protein